MSNVVKTATSSTTCTCCGSGTLATLSSRHRGGPATICGNSENAGFASTPPKKYRKKRTTGSILTCDSSSPCNGVSTTNQQSATLVYDSGNDFDVLTCVQTNFNLNHIILCRALSPPLPAPVPVCPTTINCAPAGTLQLPDSWKLPATGGTCFSFAGINGQCVFGPPGAINATQQSVTRSNFCCGSGGPRNVTTTGTIIETLSNEDTDADAMARAAPSFTWSAFTTALTSDLAVQSPRTTGFSFTFVEVEFRVDGTGLAALTAYTVNVEVWRAVTGSGIYSLFQTLIYSVSTDSAGDFSFTDTVPTASGFDTYVTNPRIF